MECLGIIAGGGPLPVVAAREARMQGIKVVAIAVEEAASADLAGEVDEIRWVGAGQLGRLIAALKREKVTDAVMLGKIPLGLLFSRVKIDLAGLLFYLKLKDRRGDTILAGVSDLLMREGITLHDCRQFLSSIVLRKGLLTARAPSASEQQDISFGRELARSMARLRIGQTVVVKRRTVLAVEAIEGTDAAIRRGGTLGNGGVVVVKVGRPDQDMRFDLPVVGPDTVTALEDAGATALALDADHTLMLNREKVAEAADRLGLAIVAD
ncbi:UDP-2,3-diacylglucosamine diphosphatase LpxI [Candidatus Methylomirabilis sp.]|uniref:UDP-2,3-diacylglucosamine diphosphatase LpxI n=1 Tax=Candidatus Methylomirabilis tolerans TaxID=3123416 RepID=A0AAJ1AFT4_9BACT|nr:UDP-2,3-diacylglucosamine diphosphatase LpxI [Candidatus Methylomirabilis sp.]